MDIGTDWSGWERSDVLLVARLAADATEHARVEAEVLRILGGDEVQPTSYLEYAH